MPRILIYFFSPQLSSCLSGGVWYCFSGAEHRELSCWVLHKPRDGQSSSIADSSFSLSPSDHSGVQLFHIHSLYPAGLGEAGR